MSEETFDVIVVGAGVLGVATAFYMQKNNPDKKILLVDRTLAAGQANTAMSAAAVRNMFASSTNQILTDTSIKYFEHVQDEGHDLLFEKTGYLWLLSKKQFEHESVQVWMQRMKKSGISYKVYNKKELKEMIPGLDVDFVDDEAAELIYQNDKLIGLLQEGLSKVSRNRYNIEVLLSIAYVERYTLNTVLNLAKAEDLLVDASKGGSSFSGVVSHLVEAHKLVGKIQREQADMYSDLQRVWGKSRFPKDEDVNGKMFVYVFDDVKDHFAARRRGLDYMIAPFQRMEMEKWQAELETIIVDYAEAKNVSIKGFEKERLED